MNNIKITELQSQCYSLESDTDEFKTCHPKQIISSEIPIPIWKITYGYDTNRGNRKAANKYIIRAESDWDCIDNEFNLYISDFNERNPERILSNVEILDVKFWGKLEIELE